MKDEFFKEGIESSKEFDAFGVQKYNNNKMELLNYDGLGVQKVDMDAIVELEEYGVPRYGRNSTMNTNFWDDY